MCYSIGTQIYTFICDNRYGLAILPLTISLCVYVYLNYRHILFLGENNISVQVKNKYNQIFLTLYISILLGILIINYVDIGNKAYFYIKFSLYNEFLIYSILIGFLFHAIFLLNHVFIFYRQSAILLLATREQTQFFVISCFLTPVIFIGVMWGIYDTFLIKKYNIFFQTLCLFLEGFLLYIIFYFLLLLTLYIFRKFSLYLNRFYQ